MKKSALLLVLLLNCCFLFAQKPDTAKRWVEGAQMLSADDIIQNASQSKQLSTFVLLADKAGLTDTLKNLNPVTVFVPDNQAFEKLNTGILDTLEKPTNKQQLAMLLLSHVVAGKITAKDMAKQIRLNNGQASLITLSGHKLIATIDANRNIVLTDENGGQSVVSKFDIRQKNGYLDIVTAVLIPKDALNQTIK